MTVISVKPNLLRTELREFLKLAVPLASAQVAQSATGFVDTVMMGRMGAEVLAAGELAAVTFLSIMTAASDMAIAIPLLIIAAIAQVLDGFQKAVYGSLQGLQDTRIPMLLNVLGYWGVGLSMGYLLGFHLGMGSVGLWIGQSIAIAIVAGLFIWRFQKLMTPRKPNPLR